MAAETQRVRPVAVVAMGDASMEDDGVALRVLGRVRPLLGEIALIGERSWPAGRRSTRASKLEAKGRPAWLRAVTLPHKPTDSRTRRSNLVSLVDWIEGGTSLVPIQHLLENRRRIVLLAAAPHGQSPGGVQHWHVDRRDKSRLNIVQFYTSVLDDSLDHLPFWMEDHLPENGTDLIAIEPYRISPANDLSPVLRSRLSSITSQVGGLLVRILEEEGWRFSSSPMRSSRQGKRRRDTAA